MAGQKIGLTKIWLNFDIMYTGLIKSKRLIFLLLGIIGFAIISFMPANKPGAQAINWMDFDRAVKLNKEHPKKIFIDVYTQWCGWCKRMDASTYQDKEIIEYMNKYFYAVRLDAETKDTFHFNDHKFVNSNAQKGSVNELAYSLLDGKMSYPTTVYMDEKFNRLTIYPGYVQTSDLKPILKFFAEEKYKTMNYEDFRKALAKADSIAKSKSN